MKESTIPESLWTAEEVADYLQVAVGTINQWVKAKRIPVVKVGRLNRFQPDAIREWVGSGSSDPYDREHDEDRLKGI